MQTRHPLKGQLQGHSISERILLSSSLCPPRLHSLIFNLYAKLKNDKNKNKHKHKFQISNHIQFSFISLCVRGIKRGLQPPCVHQPPCGLQPPSLWDDLWDDRWDDLVALFQYWSGDGHF